MSVFPRSPSLSRLVLSVGLLGLLVSFLTVASGVRAQVAPPIPPSADDVTKNALAGLGRTASWTVNVPNAAAVDLWATAPADLATVSVRAQIRYILIEQSDSVNVDKAACVRLGAATNVPALVCTAGSQNGKPLTSFGASFQIQARPITSATVPANAVVPLWARAATATSVHLTITVGW